MSSSLREMSVAAHLVDLERERKLRQLCVQVPKSRYLSRIVTYIGTQIVALGTWMQRIEPINA